MRSVVWCALFSLALVFFVTFSAWADSDLPAPQTEGGMGLFEALKKRSSAPGGDFPTGPLKAEELSTILWAATGLNRGEKGWTVPMAMGVEPYCKIYVVQDDGIFLYSWKEHSLIEISKENARAKVGAQNFVKNAPTILIVVSDSEKLARFQEPERSAFAHVLTGAMTQDVYLASAALNVGARYLRSMNEDAIREALKLKEGDRPICLVLLGK